MYIVVFGGGWVGADFYCHKAGLVIELDGDIHDLQKEEDAAPLSYGHPPIFAS
ncbi:MAG: DUF559 domain-containing protein [Chloroflexi bacterium]|nr:DUF559 domain-containing protein [Chloroflexota bacterium]